MIRFNLPDITWETHDTKKDVSRIREYLIVLTSELEYQLGAVDEGNLTPDLLERISGTAQAVESINDRLDVIEASIINLKNRVSVLEGN